MTIDKSKSGPGDDGKRPKSQERQSGQRSEDENKGQKTPSQSTQTTSNSRQRDPSRAPRSQSSKPADRRDKSQTSAPAADGDVAMKTQGLAQSKFATAKGPSRPHADDLAGVTTYNSLPYSEADTFTEDGRSERDKSVAKANMEKVRRILKRKLPEDSSANSSSQDAKKQSTEKKSAVTETSTKQKSQEGQDLSFMRYLMRPPAKETKSMPNAIPDTVWHSVWRFEYKINPPKPSSLPPPSPSQQPAAKKVNYAELKDQVELAIKKINEAQASVSLMGDNVARKSSLTAPATMTESKRQRKLEGLTACRWMLISGMNAQDAAEKATQLCDLGICLKALEDQDLLDQHEAHESMRLSALILSGLKNSSINIEPPGNELLTLFDKAMVDKQLSKLNKTYMVTIEQLAQEMNQLAELVSTEKLSQGQKKKLDQAQIMTVTLSSLVDEKWKISHKLVKAFVASYDEPNQVHPRECHFQWVQAIQQRSRLFSNHFLDLTDQIPRKIAALLQDAPCKPNRETQYKQRAEKIVTMATVLVVQQRDEYVLQEHKSGHQSIRHRGK